MFILTKKILKAYAYLGLSYIYDGTFLQIQWNLLNIGQLQVLKNLSVIERYQLLGGNLKKIVTFGT